MSDATILRVPVRKYVDAIATIRIVTIISVAISMIIDYFKSDGSHVLDELETQVPWRIVGFLGYQMTYYLIIRWAVDFFNESAYPFLSFLEFLYGYFYSFYPETSKEKLELMKKSFEYTLLAYEYSVQIFLILRLASFVIFSLTYDENQHEKESSGKIFRIHYKKLEKLLFVLTGANYVMLPIAVLYDFSSLSKIGSELENEPFLSVLMILSYGISIWFFSMFHHWVSVYPSPSLKNTDKQTFYNELTALVFLLFYWNGPLRNLYPEVQEHLKEVLPWVSFILPISAHFTTALLLFHTFLYLKIICERLEAVRPFKPTVPRPETKVIKSEAVLGKPSIFKVHDDAAESSTKDEIHVHRNHWLRKL